jgi:hypothetical protein
MQQVGLAVTLPKTCPATSTEVTPTGG